MLIKIYKIKNIYYQLKNVIKWLPIIWKDRDWDYGYFYRILYFKLKNMEKYFNHSLCAKERAKEIRIAKNLVKRLIDSNYLENAMMFFDTKYGDKEIIILKDGAVIWNKDKKMVEEFRKCSEHSNYLELQDKDYLFDYIKKHINGWWD